MKFSGQIILTLFVCLLFTTGLLFAGQWSQTLNFNLGENTYLNSQARYQLVLVFISALSIGSAYFMNPQNYRIFFKPGQIGIGAEEMKAFGIKAGDSWIKTGLSLSLVISSATFLFMYFQLKGTESDFSQLISNGHWILLFALSNSFAEEMIFRLAIVVPLFGKLSSGTICWISAILFGLPHFAGMPDGLLGASMAALLGYVLCKSMLETRGFFWAWLIHWFQDIIIMGALCLLANPV